MSCDARNAQRAFAEAEGYAFPLFSDFWSHGEVPKRHGMFRTETEFSTRGTVLVDTDGVPHRSVMNEEPSEARPSEVFWEAVVAR